MNDEGSIHIDPRRFGALAFLRRKQWWSFEGLDVQQGVYFVFLALQGFPSDYVSLKVVDYASNRWRAEDHLGGFRASPGDRVDVAAEGAWGHLRFAGQAESGWQIDVETPKVAARLAQEARAGAHRNRLLTRHLDYHVLQFVLNTAAGSLKLFDAERAFAGYGYCEHNWGVQPRHSTADWLHFWTPEAAGVVMSCYYDAGVPHHYTYLWSRGEEHYLYSPAHFRFDSRRPDQPWSVLGPDLLLEARPVYTHHSRMRIPPRLPYIDIDYYESLLQVHGRAWCAGEPVDIDGMGKHDHNWNLW